MNFNGETMLDNEIIKMKILLLFENYLFLDGQENQLYYTAEQIPGCTEYTVIS